ERIMYVLNTPPEIAEKPDALALPKCKGVVSIENVSFGYNPGVAVLQNVSLQAHPGQIIALVGRTGAGKSTLVTLVPRLIDPWEGRVLLDGYDTVLGERGVTLSGGERQRLSIARAILKDAPVLILDEPTSALDSQTEKLLLDALERLMANRTTFLIAHRLSTVRKAHRIVVLDQGRIVETGTHEELLRRGGAYAHLHQLQFQTAA